MDDKSAYQIIVARISQRDGLLWQVPGLSLTAQAFLFTISLGDSSSVSRLIASSLSIVTSVLSMHLMLRHRKLTDLDIELLEEYKKQDPTSTQHASLPGPLFHSSHHSPFSLEWFKSSFNVWLVGLGLFGLAAALVFILTLFNASLLSHNAQ